VQVVRKGDVVHTAEESEAMLERLSCKIETPRLLEQISGEHFDARSKPTFQAYRSKNLHHTVRPFLPFSSFAFNHTTHT
jgi:hypothetical protein